MKKFLTILVFLAAGQLTSVAQNKLAMSQYMHNQYAINPAFAGSREVLTAFAAHRQQWTGVPMAPTAQFFTVHAPLKNDNIALGLSLFNENFTIAQNTGFTTTYAYRVKLDNGSRLAFSLDGGLIFSQTSWEKIDLLDEDDEAFGRNESEINPKLGFGSAWYNHQFFAGFSIPNMFHVTEFETGTATFEPTKINYLFTAGFLHQLNPSLAVQTSTLLRYNPNINTIMDFSGNVIIHHLIWTGITYRTNNEIIGLLGWQVTPQFRVAYSYDYPTGDLSNLNSGSHEVSLQFDFGYKISTVSPRFF